MSAEKTKNHSPTKHEKKHTKGLREEGKEVLETSANEAIFFKIIYNEREFDEFNSMQNLEHVFHPKFTFQLFPNEVITGYKNPKILISLTPKFFYPCVKVTYESKLEHHDNLQEILSKLFTEVYTEDKNKFLEKLNEEKQCKEPKGIKFFTEQTKEIYLIDIEDQGFYNENFNFQTMCKFFIDGASYIGVDSHFWRYFHLISRKDDDWKTLGFCSQKNFHMELNKYVSMLSQFLIFPPYQRKGNGTLLLKECYNNLIKDEKCVEITTEDPCIDFILMRDFTILDMILSKNYFDEFLKEMKNKNEIDSKEQYSKFDTFFTKEKIKEITKSFKLQQNLISRSIEIAKFSLCGKDTLELCTIDKKEQMKTMLKNKETETIFTQATRGPFIYFYDEPEFNALEEIEEEKKMIPQNVSFDDKVGMLYSDYERDIKKIIPKCLKIILEIKAKINK